MDAVTYIAISTILLLARSVSSREDKSKCNQEIVTTCLIPLKEVDYNVASAVVPQLDEETLNDHCRRYSMFETCMKDVRPYCSSIIRLIYQGIEDSYEWLCRDGMNEYLTYKKCFNNQELRKEGDTCNNTLTQSLQNVNKKTQLSSSKAKYICLYFSQYLDCVQNVVVAFCGADAALWQRKLDEKSLIPVLEAINCRIAITEQKIPEITWMPITIGMSLSFSMLIIFAVIVLFCLKRRRQTRSSSCDPPAPPPYEESPPFIVYDGSVSNLVLPVGDRGHPMPSKVGPDLGAGPIPPYTGQVSSATPGRDASTVDTDYFGASVSGVSVSVPTTEASDAKADAEEEPEDGYTKLHRHDDADPDRNRISNPDYVEVGTVGYFGATSNQASNA